MCKLRAAAEIEYGQIALNQARQRGREQEMKSYHESITTESRCRLLIRGAAPLSTNNECNNNLEIPDICPTILGVENELFSKFVYIEWERVVANFFRNIFPNKFIAI